MRGVVSLKGFDEFLPSARFWTKVVEVFEWVDSNLLGFFCLLVPADGFPPILGVDAYATIEIIETHD